MNIKTVVHLSMLLLATTAQLFGCTITLINDLTTPVNIILADKTVIRIVAGDQTTFGQSDQLTEFIFLKQVQGKTYKYKVTQTSCSPTHEIDIYASTIGTEEINYFSINLNAQPSGGCGCGHKDRPR